MAPLLRVSVWLLAAQAILAGLYWGLLSTPESNVMMLAASTGLAALLLLLGGLTLDVAIKLWLGRPARLDGIGGWLRPGLRLIPALVVFGAIAAAAQWYGAYVEAQRGAITAVIILRTGWADPEILFTVVAWTVAMVRWVVAPMAGLALFGALTRSGWAGLATGWPWRALAWRALVTGAAVGLVLHFLWPAMASWRPSSLPATWVQMAFLAMKLGVVAVAAAVGLALVIRQTAIEADTHPASVPPR